MKLTKNGSKTAHGRAKIIEFLGGKKIGVNLHELGLGRQWFLSYGTQRQTTRETVDHLDYIKV